MSVVDDTILRQCYYDRVKQDEQMWYSVEALFRCDVEDETDDILYDRTIFLIDADKDEKLVSKKALQTARKFQHSYESLGKKVSWKLVKVLQIQNLVIKELHDGVEVFSYLMWEHEVSEEFRLNGQNIVKPLKKQKTKK